MNKTGNSAVMDFILVGDNVHLYLLVQKVSGRWAVSGARPCFSSFSVMHLLNSKVPRETCNQGGNGQQQLCLGLTYPLNLSPRPSFLWLFTELTAALPWFTSVTVTFASQRVHTALRGSLLSYNVSRVTAALPRLSPVASSILSPSFVSLTLAFINVLSKRKKKKT